jgi:hypothetical protein
MNQFPASFRSHSRFAELQALVAAINSHEAMRVGSPHILNNMIRASLAFTSCFYANLLVSLEGELKQLRGRSPFVVTRRTDQLHLLIALADEELATDNLVTKQGGMSPHFVPMFEASQAAGIGTEGIEQHILLLSQGASMSEACDGAGFRDSLKQYFSVSEWCSQSYSRSFATIALRELTLANNFQVIVDHLPDEPRLGSYKYFLTEHIGLDAGERKAGEANHAELMSEALERVEDVSKALEVMIRFYEARLAVYEDCLQPEPLF